MNGNELLLDTNILVYALKGLANVRPYFDTPSNISVITEIEILGVKDISPSEIKIREAIVGYCSVTSLIPGIRKKAIELKRKIKVPIPDAIITATAIEEGLTLVTADKGFRRIKELSLILIEV